MSFRSVFLSENCDLGEIADTHLHLKDEWREKSPQRELRDRFFMSSRDVIFFPASEALYKFLLLPVLSSAPSFSSTKPHLSL